MAPRPSLPPSTKKRKLDNGSNQADDVSQKIQALETELTSAVANRTSLNPLTDLVDIARNASDPSTLSKSIYALYRIFVVITTTGMLHGPLDETAKAVRSWLNERLQGYTHLLVCLLKDERSSLRTSALNILMSLQKHLSTSVTKTSSTGPQWHNAHFRQVVNGLLTCPSTLTPSFRPKKRKAEITNQAGASVDLEIRDLFVDKWLSVNDDVRWFFMRESAGILSSLKQDDHPEVAANLLSFLESLNTFPTESSELNSWWVEELGAKPPQFKAAADDAGGEGDDGTNQAAGNPTEDSDDDWRKYFEDEAPVAETKKVHVRLHKLSVHQSLHSLGAHRAMFTRTWLSLLPHLSIGSEASKKALATRALNVMHRGVMPHLTRAVLVMDWIGSCVDYGGSVGLLALNALFILMKEYNLDYPSFYTRLYTFLDRDVLHLKHRARFFRMMELFLSSTHLPVTLLASFVKRLARLSLSAPPTAIVMIIPFTYNIMKKHPSLMTLVHQDDGETETDPFDDSEPNPTKTQALDSSLWELYSHKHHYHSAVSTLAKIFSEAFTKPSYALEDFLDHTYATLFDTEVKRKIKKEPALAVELAQRMWFQNAPDDGQVNTIEDLWCFT